MTTPCNRDFIHTFNRLKVDCGDGVLNPSNVKFYGAKGDGTTDDTIAIQNGVSNSSGTLYFPAGTYIVSSITIAANMTLIGTGNSSCIKTIDNSTATSTIQISGDDVKVVFRDLCFDGNNQNNTYGTTFNMIDFRSEGDTNYASLSVFNCVFNNQVYSSIQSNTSSNNTNDQYILIDGCKFYGGYLPTLAGSPSDSPTYVSIIRPQYANVINNFFDVGQNTDFGICGVVIVQTGGSYTEEPNVNISNNYFKQCGRGDSATGAGGLGAIEFYQEASGLRITGNYFTNCQLGAIRGKADAKGIVISNNVIDGLISNETEAAITIARSTQDDIASDNFVITGNVIQNIAGFDGIIVWGGHTGTGVDRSKNTIVSNNVIQTCKHGILLQELNNFICSNNIIETCTGVGLWIISCENECNVNNNRIDDTANSGILTATSSTMTINLNNNTVLNTTLNGISIDTVASAYLYNNIVDTTGTIGINTATITGELVVQGGKILNATGVDISTPASVISVFIDFPSIGFDNDNAPSPVVIASGVMKATSNIHTVDTEGSAATDDLDTINGGFRWGQLLNLVANADARTVVVKDGTGNISCAGDFSLTNSEDSILLRWNGSAWCEISRSDNTA